MDAEISGRGDIPVVHIFGVTEEGKKACVHIHGALPYLVTRVGGDLTDRVRGLMCDKLNRLLHTELTRNKKGSSDSYVPQHIHHVEPFQAKCMYGFHSRMETFARIYFTNPFYVTKLGGVLGQLATENPMMQPFEAHVPFILQFFIDNSIFGMDWVSFKHVRYRIADGRPDADLLYDGLTVGDARMSPDHRSPKSPSTTCWVEVDAYVSDIMNAQLHSENVHSSNPGLEYIWKEEAERCRLQNRTLNDAFNQYTPRPYPVIRSEKETLSRLRAVARKMREEGEGETSMLNETLSPSSPLGGSYPEAREVEQLWSKAVDDTARWNETKHLGDEWEEEEIFGEAEEDDDEEMPQPDVTAEVDAGRSRGQEPGPLTQRITALDTTVSEIGTPDGENAVPNFATSQCGGVWIKPKQRLPLRRRMKKKTVSDVAAVVVPRADPGAIARVQATMRNKMLFSDDTMERTELEETPSPENAAATDGHIEETKNVCVASLELFAFTQHKMPDAVNDPVLAVSLCIATDACCSEAPSFHRVITVIPNNIISSPNTIIVAEEADIFEKVAEIVNRYDPDILIGYDVDRLSWGYMLRRSEVLGQGDLLHKKLGRYVNPRKPWQRDPALMKHVDGRLVESVWRTVRRDLQLRSYDAGSAALHVLKKRIPVLTNKALSKMYTSIAVAAGRPIHEHIQRLSHMNISLLYKMDWFIRNAEMARVYGIQFHEVWTRGSQLRVESMLLRLAHKLNFVAPSVTPEQRDRMCAPEQLQLILEPKSKVYHDPVIVLDFQSLYPSMVIAYNYCYSTLFGKVPLLSAAADLGTRYIQVGALQYDIDKSTLRQAASSREIHTSPLSAAFAKVATMQGVMPTMLREILGARIMVKTAMKNTKSKRLLRILDARQLALKLVANVTYGYTAANWSGRMPCVEVADAILAKGRETLERAISMVSEGDYGGAKVIYGDTDSMFVLVPGASVEQAFAIGRRIAAAVTADNPAPVVLKLEKVYSGCVLETKKRYAGWMFESETDTPKLDAKGIETVRRDTCPIVAKILERSLELILQRKYARFYGYLDRKLSSLHNLHFSEFVFCKEYRGDYEERAHVPQKKIAQYYSSRSPGYYPLRGERLPYVMVRGDPDANVISTVRSIDEFIDDPDLKINVPYYVRAHILAALRRVTDLIPMTIEYLDEGGRDCFSEKCISSGSIPWCGSCVSNDKSYLFATLNVAREERLMAMARQVCTYCQHSREVDIEACGNYHCTMHRIISSVSRSVAPMALFQHDHSFDQEEKVVEVHSDEEVQVREQEVYVVEDEPMEEEEFRPNSTLRIIYEEEDGYSRL